MPVSFPDIGKYFLAVGGSAGAAGAQFLLSLVLLHRFAPQEFGRFAFLLVLAQFLWSLGTALFCAPLARLEAERNLRKDSSDWQGLTIANQAFAACMTLVLALAALAMHVPLPATLLYGALIGLGTIRQFCRVAAYSRDKQNHVMAADTTYVLSICAGSAWIALSPPPDLASAFLVLMTGNLLALLWLTGYFDFRLSRRSLRGALTAYASIWRRFSHWSLIGVVATEATANAHSYIVTIFLGPQAFVPIAAGSLLMRPCTVALNGISELERGRIAHDLVSHRPEVLSRRIRTFRITAGAIWLATVGAMFGVLAFAPGVVFGRAYDLNEIALSAVLWATIVLVRTVYLPEAITLQASGAFRMLALPTICAAPVSIGGVILLIQIASPVWSLVGIALGEVVAGGFVMRAARNMIRAARDPLLTVGK